MLAYTPGGIAVKKGALSMLKVTDVSFDQDVLKSQGLVLVDFWAAWCMPCRMLAPILDRVDKDYGHKSKVAKLNVDENQMTAGRYNIMGIPTMVLFKDGKEVERISGVVPEQHIKALIDRHTATK